MDKTKLESKESSARVLIQFSFKVFEECVKRTLKNNLTIQQQSTAATLELLPCNKLGVCLYAFLPLDNQGSAPPRKNQNSKPNQEKETERERWETNEDSHASKYALNLCIDDDSTMRLSPRRFCEIQCFHTLFCLAKRRKNVCRFGVWQSASGANPRMTRCKASFLLDISTIAKPLVTPWREQHVNSKAT